MARSFLSTSDKIVIPYSSSLALTGTAFTIACWVYPTNVSQYRVIIGKPYTSSHSSPYWDWFFGLEQTTGKLDCWIASGNHKVSTTGLTLNTWTHCAVTYDGANFRFYANAAADGSPAETQSVPNANSRDIVISSNAAASEYASSHLANVCVWNATLTAGEIYGHMVGRMPRRDSLKLWMPIYGLGSPEPDYSGNGNHGTVSGTAVVANAPMGPMFGFDLGWQGNRSSLQNYSLAAAAGSFSLSGQTASLKAARTLSAAQGSYALTGQVAALKHGFALSSAYGAFTLSGQAAGVLAARKITATQGSFALSGQTAALRKTWNALAAVQGSFVLSGQVATLRKGFGLIAAQGAFTLTGQTAGLAVARKIVAAQGSFSLTGQDAAFKWTHVLAALQGSFVLSGQAAGLIYQTVGAYTLNASRGTFTLTGQSSTLTSTRRLSMAVGSFAETGQAAGLLVGKKVSAAQGSFAFTGQSAALLCGRVIPVSHGSFTLSGQAAAFLRSRVVSAGVGTFTVSGQPAIFLRAYIFSVDRGTYVLTGFDASLSQGLAAQFTTAKWLSTDRELFLYCGDRMSHVYTERKVEI